MSDRDLPTPSAKVKPAHPRRARKALSKRTRFEVFKRDSFTCQYCGRRAPDVILHVDHLHPVAKGGRNDMLNLVTSCSDCNGGKSDRTLSDSSAIVAQQDQLQELQERRSQIEMMMEWKRGLVGLRDDEVKAADGFWSTLTKYRASETGLADLRKMVSRFGLGTVTDAMRVAVDKCVERDEKGVCTQASVNAAWDYMHRVCAVSRATERHPYLRDLFYIRGILRRRIAWYDNSDWQSMEILKRAHAVGVAVEDMRNVAVDAGSWTAWREDMEALIDSKGTF